MDKLALVRTLRISEQFCRPCGETSCGGRVHLLKSKVASLWALVLADQLTLSTTQSCSVQKGQAQCLTCASEPSITAEQRLKMRPARLQDDAGLPDHCLPAS